MHVERAAARQKMSTFSRAQYSQMKSAYRGIFASNVDADNVTDMRGFVNGKNGFGAHFFSPGLLCLARIRFCLNAAALFQVQHDDRAEYKENAEGGLRRQRLAEDGHAEDRRHHRLNRREDGGAAGLYALKTHSVGDVGYEGRHERREQDEQGERRGSRSRGEDMEHRGGL